jgi:hypothetical protein
MAEDACPRDLGFESRHILDVRDTSYYISNEKKKNKGSQMGHTKKVIFIIKIIFDL